MPSLLDALSVEIRALGYEHQQNVHRRIHKAQAYKDVAHLGANRDWYGNVDIHEVDHAAEVNGDLVQDFNSILLGAFEWSDADQNHQVSHRENAK